MDGHRKAAVKKDLRSGGSEIGSHLLPLFNDLILHNHNYLF